MSKATEYLAKYQEATVASAVANEAQQAVAKASPEFTWDTILLGQKGRACVTYEGSLYVHGLLPINKVADFVKWLGETYGD